MQTTIQKRKCVEDYDVYYQTAVKKAKEKWRLEDVKNEKSHNRDTYQLSAAGNEHMIPDLLPAYNKLRDANMFAFNKKVTENHKHR